MSQPSHASSAQATPATSISADIPHSQGRQPTPSCPATSTSTPASSGPHSVSLMNSISRNILELIKMSDSTIEDGSVHPIVSSSYRKPNPRAFSKTDCHTCKSLGRICGRQRPQCSTCLSHKVKCGGFATPLLWGRGSNLRSSQSELGEESGKNHKRSSNSSDLPQLSDSEYYPVEQCSKSIPSPLLMGDSTPSRKFKFVNGRTSKRQKRPHLPLVNNKVIQEHCCKANEGGDSETKNAHTSTVTIAISAPDDVSGALFYFYIDHSTVLTQIQM
jgi:hypothetical protein